MELQHNTLTVFVVDDEPGMLAGAERALRDHTLPLLDIQEEIAFRVKTFDSAESLLDALKTEKPDLLLLDNKLPGKSGAAVLEEFARNKTSICTIMITAYATLENVIQTIKLGAYDFLPKPFTPDELRYSVAKAARDIILTQKARKLAQERKRIRFEFITVLAHELKAPLNAIESYIDIIQNKRSGDKLEDYTAMIERVSLRLQGMRKLVLDLLDLTAIESGDRKRNIAPVDLYQIAYQVTDLLKEESDAARLRVVISPDKPLLFNADADDMELILCNLVSNAIKYNRSDGRVEIRLAPEGKDVRIQVADSGIGIKPEDQTLLFREFSRIKNEATLLIPGSGLGLSIVKKVVALYNGEILLESEAGKGTTFTLTLKNRE